MSRPKSGCMGCAERHLHCHGQCEKYRQFREELEKQNRQRHLDNEARDILIDHARKRKEERRKKDKRCSGMAGMYWLG